MIVNYKQHHIDDFRAGPKQRIQDENYKHGVAKRLEVNRVTVARESDTPQQATLDKLGKVGRALQSLKISYNDDGSISIKIFNPEVQTDAVVLTITKDEIGKQTVFSRNNVTMNIEPSLRTTPANDYIVDLAIQMTDTE